MALRRRKTELQNLKSEWMLAEFSISYKIKPNRLPHISSPEEIYIFLKQIWRENLINVQEQCVAVFLNNSKKIIGYRQITTGTMKACLIDVKLIASLALHSLCEAVVIAHNHPSGTLKPSAQDEAITFRVKEALLLIDVKLIDHMIITEDGFYSFASDGLL